MQTYDRHLNLKEIQFDINADKFDMAEADFYDDLQSITFSEFINSLQGNITLIVSGDSLGAQAEIEFAQAMGATLIRVSDLEPIIELTEANIISNGCQCYMCKRRLN